MKAKSWHHLSPRGVQRGSGSWAFLLTTLSAVKYLPGPLVLEYDQQLMVWGAVSPQEEDQRRGLGCPHLSPCSLSMELWLMWEGEWVAKGLVCLSYSCNIKVHQYQFMHIILQLPEPLGNKEWDFPLQQREKRSLSAETGICFGS